MFRKPKMVERVVEIPTLYPMGALTFAIACSHCKNWGTLACAYCKAEIRSGFELKEKNNAD